MSPAALDVLKRDIPWETYMTAKLINSTDLQLLRRYDHKPESVQAALLDEVLCTRILVDFFMQTLESHLLVTAQNGAAYVAVFLNVVRNINKEETVEYILAVIDELLSGEICQFRECQEIWDPLMNLIVCNSILSVVELCS